MRTLLSAVSVFSLVVSSALLGGCEVTDCKTDDGKDAKCAESLTAFKATEKTIDLDYVGGASITIKGVYGDISVVPGAPGTVSTTFEPFNYRGHSQETDARRELAENLELDASADGDGNVTITTHRSGATNGLGALITVAIPPEFNATLIVENDGDGVINQGAIMVTTVAEATTLNVLNHGLNSCRILEGKPGESIVSNLTDVDVRCEADIIVRGVNDNVVVQSRSPAFHADVVVEIMSVSATAIGGSITGDDSNVQVTFPLAGDYEVVANGSGGAHISKVEAADCEVPVNDETDLQLSCGAGGPIYEISASDEDADDEDTSRINVYVR